MNNKSKKNREKKKPEKNGKAELITEEFAKSISNLTCEEKLEASLKKLCGTVEETQSLSELVKYLETKLSHCDKEKEKLLADTTKRVLAQSRLEGVCRELQRQNKLLKDENLQKIREEEEKRREVSNKFQTALNEVTAIMHENSEKNLKLRDDNIEMSTKFQKICDQFKEKEEDFTRLKKQLKLEKQLADATVKKAQCELNAEREIWNREKERMDCQLKISEEERAKLELNLQALQNSLTMYNEKYEEFETTISRSNKVFSDYKSEMGKMSKQVGKLEEDCVTWKRKWEQAANMIINLKNEKRMSETMKATLERKITSLSNLCRSLQEERTLYMNQLRENNIEPVSYNKQTNVKNSPEPPELSKDDRSILPQDTGNIVNGINEINGDAENEVTNKVPPEVNCEEKVKNKSNRKRKGQK